MVFQYFKQDNFEALNSDLWSIGTYSSEGHAITPVIQSAGGLKMACSASNGGTNKSHCIGMNKWCFQGNFDVVLTFDNVTTGNPGCGPACVQLYDPTGSDDTNILHLGSFESNLVSYYNVVNGSWNLIASKNVSAGAELILRYTRTGATTSAYILIGRNWSSFGGNSSQHGSDDVALKIYSGNWQNGNAVSCVLKNINIKSADYVKALNSFTIDVTAESNSGELKGYGSITPIETTSPVNIVQIG
jgi:hypothetical protein